MIDNIYSFRNLIFKTIVPIINNAQDKEDVVNEVFYKALLKADSYNPELGTLATWLKRIAKNTALDFVRKASYKYETPLLDFVRKANYKHEKTVQVEDMMYDSYADSGLVAVEYDDRAYQIEMSIKNLNKRDQFVVRSFYYDRLSHCEIAELLGVKTNSVGMIIKRCNEKIKKDFSQRGLSERDF